MNDKDKRRGFAALSDLTSDIQATRQFIEIISEAVQQAQSEASTQSNMINDQAQAHGHSETGLPAQKKESGQIPITKFAKSFFGTLCVSYLCPNCGEPLRSPFTDAGKPDYCPTCRAQFVVPGSN